MKPKRKLGRIMWGIPYRKGATYSDWRKWGFWALYGKKPVTEGEALGHFPLIRVRVIVRKV